MFSQTSSEPLTGLGPVASYALAGHPLWQWAIFATVVIVLLALDLGVLNRRDRTIGIRRSLALSAFYITAGLAFGGFVWWSSGPASAMEYATGFLLEKTLAMDNVFVIATIFAALAIPRHLQHRVLFWGILGAIVLRALMIGIGAALVTEFHWILLGFGAFLIWGGIKMLMGDGDPPDFTQGIFMRLLKKAIPVTPDLHGHAFMVRAPDKTGRLVRHATPMLVALVLIETADVVFAVDSVPAIFAVTTDPFIVYTSNIFAILGLRALYFALAAMIHRFGDLKYALSLILVFIGGKIFWAEFMGKPPAELSLIVTASLILGGVVVSMIRSRGAPPAPESLPLPQPSPDLANELRAEMRSEKG
ncbi:TerC family protein [Tistrella bauzanensis]|uniref:TerC family protein n=1 Tax=Tistrella TaxID=171436 RepID=UPI0031FB394A